MLFPWRVARPPSRERLRLGCSSADRRWPGRDSCPEDLRAARLSVSARCRSARGHPEGMSVCPEGTRAFQDPALVHVPLVTMPFLHRLHIFLRLLRRFAAVLRNDFVQCRVDVRGHPGLVAADKKIGPLLQPLPNLLAVLEHFRLHEDPLPGYIPAPRERHSQKSIRKQLFKECPIK